MLSFGTIFITWVNHQEALKLVGKCSHPFIYANGFLMMAVVFVPFPTALLGQNLLTRHASPAVVLYSATGVLMSLGWALVSRSALQPVLLTRNARATARVRSNARNSHFAVAFYLACTIVAFWLPLAIAAVITVMWIYWLIYGIRTLSDPHSD